MKIKYQLSIILGLSIVLSIAIVSFIFYQNQKEVLLNQTFLHLESIAETKKIRIRDLIEKKQELVRIMSKNELVQSELIGVSQADNLKNHFKDFKSIRKVYLIDTLGMIKFATDSSFSINSISKNKNFILAKQGSIILSDYSYTKSGGLTIRGYAPVHHKARLLGILLTEIDGSDILSLTTDYTGLGKTGETTLAKKNGDIIYLTPLRYDPDAALKRKIASSDTMIGACRALIPKEGRFIGKSYRGDDIIASLRFLPGINWGMSVQINLEEAMGPIVELLKNILIINVCSVLLALMLAFSIGDYFAGKILKLISSIAQIKEGDFSKRIPINEQNEFGTLAASFNEMANKLEMKINELNNLNESLDKYAYMISHDLKSPAQNITGLAQIIKTEFINPSDNEACEIVEMLIAKSHNILDLVDNVLKSVRGDILKKESINCEHIVTEILNTLNCPANIQIVVNQLPEIIFNKIYFQQILQNLLSNSIKYMDKEVGRIVISANSQEKEIIFSVMDNGCGIARSDQEKIFEMFGKASEKINVETHGIGLAIVKKIITDNGGKIWVESEPGKGATFFFSIPKFI